MSPFFVSCPLDHEAELIAELTSFWFEMTDLDGMPTRCPLPEFKIHMGGIEFLAPEHLGFQINFFSKIANRVLLRIAKFESRYYDQFEKELKKLKLDTFLEPQKIQVKVESHKSRINNEKNILEVAEKIFREQKFSVDSEASMALYIRVDKDRVVVSLDTSGEHLHRRGYGIYKGEAPLRETLAALIVRHAVREFGRDVAVVDPFAGSGTMIFEFLSQCSPNFHRDYSWLKFKSCPKLFKSTTWVKNYRWTLPALKNVSFGYDVSESAITNCEKNQNGFNSFFGPADIKFKVLDSELLGDLELAEWRATGKKVVVITNPPYGVRLSEGNVVEIFKKLENQVDGIVVVHPEKWKFDFKRLKVIKQLPFSNQGLRLKLSIFRV